MDTEEDISYHEVVTGAPLSEPLGKMDRTWQVTRLHHVAFAHSGDSPPGVISDLPGLPCTHEEHAAGFVERMLPAGESYLQLLEATETPRPGGMGTRIAFVHPASCQGLLIELAEPTDGRPERRAGSSHVEVAGGYAGR